MKNIILTQVKQHITILTFISLIILCSLGAWQMSLAKKEIAIAQNIATQTVKPITPLPRVIKNIENWNYRAVTIAGEYLHDKAILLQKRSDYHVITPFKRLSGEIILINRGLVPKDKIDDIRHPSGITKAIGYLHLPPQERPFTAGNRPTKDEWHWLDKKAIDKHLKTATFPLILYHLAYKDNGYPIGGQLDTSSSISNKHFYYGIFWFLIGFILITTYTITTRTKSKKVIA